jgi:mono/diheme cytochrome c family protein
MAGREGVMMPSAERGSNRVVPMITIVALACLYLVSAGTVFAQEPAPASDVIAKGKDIFGLACSGCHGTSHTTIQRKSAERWQKTIYTMISRGAPVLPGEVEPLTAFLSATYGPASPPPSFGGNAAAQAQQSLPAGREIVVRSCGGCHAVNLIFNARKSSAAWRQTVSQMRSFGADLTEGEEREVLDYLSRNFGTP